MLASIGKAKNHPANMHDVRAAAAPRALKFKMDHAVFLPFPRRQATLSAGAGEPGQPPQAHNT